MEELIIPRDIWYRGNPRDLALCVEVEGTKKFCCLGVYLMNHGFTPAELLGVSMPMSFAYHAENGMKVVEDRIPKWLLSDFGDANSNAACDLARYNDSASTPEATREKLISATFAKNGVKVTFVDTLTPSSEQPPLLPVEPFPIA